MFMNEEDFKKTDALVEAFVNERILSGMSEFSARKYGRYLWKICEGFDKRIDQLATDKDVTLRVFSQYISGSCGSIESYKSAFRAFCGFFNAAQSQQGEISFNLELYPKGQAWYHTYTVDDIDKFGCYLDVTRTGEFGDGGKWVFRGQGNDGWNLETSLGRVVYGNGKLHGYGDVLKAFERKSMWIFGREAYKDLDYRDFKGVNLLSLMQHYGCKTRLLDFSCSPLVALHIAIEQYEANVAAGSSVDGSIALWAFDSSALYKNKTCKEWEDCVRQDFDCADRIVNMETNYISAGITVVFPTICNRRISAQDGLFVMPNSLDYSFESNLCQALQMGKEYFSVCEFSSIGDLSSDCCGPMVKFVIGADKIPGMKKLLEKANVTARTVYPDLIGLGKYVGGLIDRDSLA